MTLALDVPEAVEPDALPDVESVEPELLEPAVDPLAEVELLDEELLDDELVDPVEVFLVWCLVVALGEALGDAEVEPVLVVSLPALLPVVVPEVVVFDEARGAGAAKPPVDTAVADWPMYQDAPSTPRVITPMVDFVDCLTRQTPLRESSGLRCRFPSGSLRPSGSTG